MAMFFRKSLLSIMVFFCFKRFIFANITLYHQLTPFFLLQKPLFMIHIDKLLVSMQHAMGKMAVANHLDGAMKVGFQPIGIHLGCCMVVERTIYARHVLYLTQHCANIVTDQDYGASLGHLFQELIQAVCGLAVEVGARLVQDEQARPRDKRTTKHGALQLSATQFANGAFLQSFQSHLRNYLMRLLAFGCGVAFSQAATTQQTGEDNLFYADGEATIHAIVLRQVANLLDEVIVGILYFAFRGLQQA
jgi:hypothetical protein